MLAAARGLHAHTFTWTRASGDDYRNDREHASYQTGIMLPDGTAALTAELRVHLPSGSYGDTLVLVDVRVRLGILLQPADPGEAAAEMRNVIASGGDPRATAGELHRIFSHAWQLAAEPSLSAFTPHSDRLQPRAAPKVELHLGIEYAHDKPSNERASLAQVVNFDSFGARIAPCRRRCQSASTRRCAWMHPAGRPLRASDGVHGRTVRIHRRRSVEAVTRTELGLGA